MPPGSGVSLTAAAGRCVPDRSFHQGGFSGHGALPAGDEARVGVDDEFGVTNPLVIGT